MQPTYVVSGLARSGTSMMMRALQAAGVTLYHNGFRRADERNPDGYFEHTDVFCNLPWDAGGKAVKVLIPHLHAMQPGDYRVVCVTRNLDDVRRSMRLQLPVEYLSDMMSKGRALLDGREDCDVLYVDYDDVVSGQGMQDVADFLGLDATPMRAVIRRKS